MSEGTPKRTVAIAGLLFEIRSVEADDSKDIYGEILYSPQVIRVQRGNPSRERRTLMHEILHGIVSEYEIRELSKEVVPNHEIALNQLAIGLCEALESLGLMLPVSSDA